MVNLKKGDKVRVIYNDGFHGYSVGDIVEVINENESIGKKFKLGSFEQYLEPRHYEVIEKPTLEVGDKVEIIHSGLQEFEDKHYFNIGETVEYIGRGKFKLGTLDQYLQPYQYKLINNIEEEEEEEVKELEYEMEHKDTIQYIYIGDTTIAIPGGTPMGISKRHPDDEYDKEIGEAIATLRFIKEYQKE